MTSPGRRPDGRPGAPPGPSTRGLLPLSPSTRRATLNSLLVAVAVLATALSGPLAVRWHAPPQWLDVEWDPPDVPPTVAPPAPIGDMDQGTGPQIPAWLGDVVRGLAIAILVGLVALAVTLVVRALRDRWRAIDRAERGEAPAGAGQASDELDEASREQMAAGVADATRTLRAALPPGDAVVAAWLALEGAAGACGVERGAAATASEFTLALLDRTPANPIAARTLLRLYHRARFSDHEVVADDVAAAASALDLLAAALAPVMAAARRPPDDRGPDVPDERRSDMPDERRSDVPDDPRLGRSGATS